MTYVKNTTSHKLKNPAKNTMFKCDVNRKVKKVRGTLTYETLCSEHDLPNFGICYIIVGRP